MARSDSQPPFPNRGVPPRTSGALDRQNAPEQRDVAGPSDHQQSWQFRHPQPHNRPRGLERPDNSGRYDKRMVCWIKRWRGMRQIKMRGVEKTASDGGIYRMRSKLVTKPVGKTIRLD